MSQLLYKIFIAAVFSGGMILTLFGLGPLLDPEKANLVLQHTFLLIVALSTCIVGGIVFVWLVESSGGPLGWPWQRMTMIVDAPRDMLLSHAQSVLESIGAHIEEDTSTSLRATKGSWWGVGGKQVITIHCSQLDVGNRLTVQSRPQIVTVLVDGGHNAQNVGEIYLALKELFHRQLIADYSGHHSKES